jgi:hypothetical protein
LLAGLIVELKLKLIVGLERPEEEEAEGQEEQEG